MDLGQQRTLTRVDQFADQAVELFLDNCPLPRASHAHAHYEAIFGADTLTMALLALFDVAAFRMVLLSYAFTPKVLHSRTQGQRSRATAQRHPGDGNNKERLRRRR